MGFSKFISKNFLKNLILVLGSLAVILVTAEKVLSIPYLYAHLIKDPHRNTDYFRDEEFKKQKDKNTYRIFLIGDSFVFSGAVKREEMVERILEERLNQNSTMRYEVFNLGKNGANPKNYYDFAKQYKAYAPDLIILSFYVDNDVMREDSGESGEVGWNTLKLVQLFSRIPHLLHSFLSQKNNTESECPQLQNLKVDEIYKKMACRGEINPYLLKNRVSIGDNQEYYDSLARRFHENPLTQKYLVATRELYPNLPMILLLNPSKYQVDPKYLADMKPLGFVFKNNQVLDRKLQDAIISWMSTHGFDVLDMLPLFQGHDDQTFYISLDDHYSPAGNSFVAEALYQKLKKDYLH